MSQGGEDSASKQHDATPYKLDKARQQGKVAKSNELSSFTALAVAAIGTFAFTGQAVHRLAQAQQQLLAFVATPAHDTATFANVLGLVLVQSLQALAPLLFCLVASAIVVSVLQTGPVFSAEPLSPQFERLNPVAGLKRLFTVRSLFELAKSLVKLGILGGVMWLSLRAALPALLNIQHAPPRAYLLWAAAAAGALMLKLLCGQGLIAAVDLLFVRWQHARDMRMSQHELEDEAKHREGDPRVRRRMREVRAELLKKSRSIGAVPSSDVIITNPTRIAVAIRYRHGESPAPQVLAKGAGVLARRIRELAAQHGIPVVCSPMLARSLYRQVDCDGYVPEESYPAVARILVWVAAMKRARADAALAPVLEVHA